MGFENPKVSAKLEFPGGGRRGAIKSKETFCGRGMAVLWESRIYQTP